MSVDASPATAPSTAAPTAAAVPGASGDPPPAPAPTAAGPRSGRWLRAAWIVGVYLVLVAHWSIFFNGGVLTFVGHDWPKEWRYLETWRQALGRGVVPWQTSVPIQGTDRFLANPETLQSPQLIALHWLSFGDFVTGNVLLLFTVGFVGLLWWRRRYRLSLTSFTILALLFSANGFITAHLAMGHAMFTGYFLLPWVFAPIFRWFETGPGGGTERVMTASPADGGAGRDGASAPHEPGVSPRLAGASAPSWRAPAGRSGGSGGGNGAPSPIVGDGAEAEALISPWRPPHGRVLLAVALTVMLWQGSLHLVVWCAMFLGLIAGFVPARRRTIGAVFAWLAVLGACRWLPAVWAFWGRSESFVGGFPTVRDLVDGLTLIRPPYQTRVRGVLGLLGWWECDFFIDVTGVFFLLWFGVVERLRRDPPPGADAVAHEGRRCNGADPRSTGELANRAFRGLALPMLAMTMLSGNFTWGLLAGLPLPLVGVERVATRFLIIPLVAAMFIGVLGFDHWWRRIGWLRSGWRWLVVGGTLQLAGALASHSIAWRVAQIELADVGRRIDWGLSLVPCQDPVYQMLVVFGWLISLVGWAGVMAAGWFSRDACTRTPASASGPRSA